MNVSTKDEHRLVFKAGFDSDNSQKRRVEEGFQLRKRQREQLMLKLRNIDPEENATTPVDDIVNDVEMLELDASSDDRESPIKESCVKLLFSDNVYNQMNAINRIDALITRKKRETVDDIVRLRLVPKLIDQLQHHRFPQVQLITAFILNEVGTQQIEGAFGPEEVGAVVQVVKTSSNLRVIEQMIFLLSNIAGESSYFRDLLLASEFLAMLLERLTSTQRVLMLRVGAFALFNFCDGADSPLDGARASMCVPVLVKLLSLNDPAAIVDSCSTICQLIERFKHLRQDFIDAGICPHLVELLNDLQPPEVQRLVVHAFADLAAGNDAQTQTIVDCNALPVLRHALDSTDKEIVKSACWAISNITAGNTNQIQAAIDANIFPKVLDLLRATNVGLKKEAAWVLRQSLSIRRTSPAQIEYFNSIGSVAALCSLLRINYNVILRLALRALRVILAVGTDECFARFEECSGELIEMFAGRRFNQKLLLQFSTRLEDFSCMTTST